MPFRTPFHLQLVLHRFALRRNVPMSTTLRLRLLVVLTCLFLLGPALLAQSLTTGDIAGTVTDPSGAVVANATVNLKGVDTGAAQSVKTTTNGDYRFRLLPPGRYRVTVDQPGFQKAETALDVAVGIVVTADINLKVATATTTVDVIGA